MSYVAKALGSADAKQRQHAAKVTTMLAASEPDEMEEAPPLDRAQVTAMSGGKRRFGR
jgi:hypothetical protein